MLHEIMVIWTLKANKMIVVCNKGTLKLKCNNNSISQLQKILGNNCISNAKFLKAKSGVKMCQDALIYTKLSSFSGEDPADPDPLFLWVYNPLAFSFKIIFLLLEICYPPDFVALA